MSAKFGTTTRDEGDWMGAMPGRLNDAIKLTGQPPNAKVAWVKQEHSGEVVIVKQGDRGQVGHADAMVTAQKNVILNIRTADCVPVFLVSDRVIGLAHAGMAGVLKHVVPHTIEAMGQLGATPDSIAMSFGPHICGDCYNMSERNLKLFEQYPEMKKHLEKRGSEHYLSMADVLTDQAEAVGVTKVKPEYDCSYEDDRYYSSRRGETDQRVMSYIVMDA